MKYLAVLLIAFFSPELLAQCAIPHQDGTLVFTADTAELCTGYWLIASTEYSAYLSSVEITASEIAEAFTWGFGTVVFFSFLAFKVEIATRTIRKL